MRSAGCAPSLEIGHRCHVVGIEAFRYDAAGNPLGKIAVAFRLPASARPRRTSVDCQVQFIAEVDCPANVLRTLLDAQVRLGGADQFENEVQGVDEDEVADAPLAAAALDKHFQLPPVTLPPGVLPGRSGADQTPTSLSRAAGPSKRSNQRRDGPGSGLRPRAIRHKDPDRIRSSRRRAASRLRSPPARSTAGPRNRPVRRGRDTRIPGGDNAGKIPPVWRWATP